MMHGAGDRFVVAAGRPADEQRLIGLRRLLHVVTKAGGIINECEKCGNASFRTGWNRSFADPARERANALFEKA